MSDEPRPEPTEEEREKFLAEGRKADAEAERAEAEAAKLAQEARVAEYEAESALIDLDKKRRDLQDELSKDRYYHRYHFKDSVSSSSVANCMEQLRRWTRQSEDKLTMEIVFTSPGGSVFDGLELFDFIQELKRDGHTINTNTLGMAASMAGILLQAGTKRTMAKEAWVLIHEIQAGSIGKVGEMEDMVEFLKRVQRRVLTIFIERSKEANERDPETHTKVMTIAFMERNWRKKDWWLSSDECLKYGIVDEVA